MVGPYHLGGRIYSIYFFDPDGIRLEITTDINRSDYDPVSSVYQTAAEVRAEREDLFGSRKAAESLVRKMPLLTTGEEPVA